MPRKITNKKRSRRGGFLTSWISKARSALKSMKGTNMYSKGLTALHNKYKPTINKKLGSNAFIGNQGIEYGLDIMLNNLHQVLQVLGR